jgi:RNA polymerase sigma-70 factor (ECF subfamily)
MIGAHRAAHRVRDALSKLPEKRRAAAMLRLDGGMSYAEIADAVGTTEGSARVLVHLAMKELRTQLSDLVDSEQEPEEA